MGPPRFWFCATRHSQLSAARFLNAEVNGDSLDLPDRAHDLDDFTMRNVAVGLNDHLAAPRLGPVADRLPRLLERRRRAFADANQQL